MGLVTSIEERREPIIVGAAANPRRPGLGTSPGIGAEDISCSIKNLKEVIYSADSLRCIRMAFY